MFFCRVGVFFFLVMNMIFGNLSAVELFIKERPIFMYVCLSCHHADRTTKEFLLCDNQVVSLIFLFTLSCERNSVTEAKSFHVSIGAIECVFRKKRTMTSSHNVPNFFLNIFTTNRNFFNSNLFTFTSHSNGQSFTLTFVSYFS